MCAGETLHDTVVSCALGVVQEALIRPHAPDFLVPTMHDLVYFCAQLVHLHLNVLQDSVFYPRPRLVIRIPDDLRTSGLLDHCVDDVVDVACSCLVHDHVLQDCNIVCVGGIQGSLRFFVRSPKLSVQRTKAVSFALPYVVVILEVFGAVSPALRTSVLWRGGVEVYLAKRRGELEHAVPVCKLDCDCVRLSVILHAVIGDGNWC